MLAVVSLLANLVAQGAEKRLAARRYQGWQLIQRSRDTGQTKVLCCPLGIKVINPLFIAIVTAADGNITLINNQNHKYLSGSNAAFAKNFKLLGIRVDAHHTDPEGWKRSQWRAVKTGKIAGLNAVMYERHALNLPPNYARRDYVWVTHDLEIPPKLLNLYQQYSASSSSVGFPLERRSVMESPQDGFNAYMYVKTEEAKRIVLTADDFLPPKGGYTKAKDFAEIIYNNVEPEALNNMLDEGQLQNKNSQAPSSSTKSSAGTKYGDHSLRTNP